jgi:hypothetical protein
MVFGNSATVPAYAMTSGRVHQPMTSQFHSGENKNQPAATGVPGALPSNQGNDGKAVVRPPPPGIPGSARPTKADGKESALGPCNTDPLSAGNESPTKQEQTTPLDNNINRKITDGANGKPANRTTGVGGENQDGSTTSSGPPGSAHSGSGVAPDPPLDDPGSHVDPKTITGNSNKGNKNSEKNQGSSAQGKNLSYAGAAALKVFNMLIISLQ